MEVNPIFNDFNTRPTPIKQSTPQQNKEANKKVLISGAATALAAIGAAGILIAKGKTNKAENVINEITPKKISNLSKKLAELNINFDKGIARRKIKTVAIIAKTMYPKSSDPKSSML